ncbi:DUF4129 domain-containing protein [Actinomadura madurae]|uniref:DUF4129 domain-containing protein n=1 Tax=Actinomadura madurae TaxID=1993 RepID=UPI003556C061
MPSPTAPAGPRRTTPSRRGRPSRSWSRRRRTRPPSSAARGPGTRRRRARRRRPPPRRRPRRGGCSPRSGRACSSSATCSPSSSPPPCGHGAGGPGRPRPASPGAWHEALDHLSDVGLSTARTLTAHEVARFGASAVGEEAHGHLGPLADLVNRSRFAASRPDPGAADQAWHHTDRLGRLVTTRAGRLRRFRRRLHPRSLRDRRARRGRHDGGG